MCGRDPRPAFRSPRTGAFSAVKLTPISASESWFLTGRPAAGLGPAPLAGPIRAKAEIITFLEPAFCHLKTYRYYGVSLYSIIGGGARAGWLGGLCSLVVAQTTNAILYIRLQRPRILCGDCDLYIHSY